MGQTVEQCRGHLGVAEHAAPFPERQSVATPRASMYVWATIPAGYQTFGSLEFAKKLLLEAQVAVSPGIGFGEYGEGYVRFALVENEQRLRQAIRGIDKTMRSKAPRVDLLPSSQ